MRLLYLPLAILITYTLLTGCGTAKNTRTSRTVQNLTSKYNILYNSNILLDESVRQLDVASPEDYSQLITVYKEPNEAAAQSIAANLDSIIDKSKKIIDDKLYSKYVDDAYLMIGKAEYYKARFFSAAEFFTYVYNNYPDGKTIRQKALVFQARSLIQLDKLEEAQIALDTAVEHVEDSRRTKRHSADVYATAAQYLIKTGKETGAIKMLQDALHAKGVKGNKLRWTYVLAQLQERNQQFDEAYKNYTSIVKSNAPFDMAFNAGLGRIAVESSKEGKEIDKVARLKSLLKDDKNRNFADQIYYRIGDVYVSRNETEQAIKSYNRAVRLSTTNQNQKGLAYLRVADIYFKNGDYIGAKTYYDSTLIALSPSYKGYDLIRRKANNLELLASRFKTIGHEDTLQTLAKLSETERDTRVGAIVREQVEKAQMLSLNNSATDNLVAGIDQPGITGTTQEGKFYFNNTSAISQGLSDFKRRWGNRKLEDNWRRSTRNAAEEMLNAADNPDAAPAGISQGNNSGPQTPEAIRENLIKSIPLTETALQASNEHIAEAYYDIASFYRDELKDKPESIKTFEDLLKRVPESSYKLSVYYNLYRLYSDVDTAKSEEYKNLLLSKYPESPFAKTIIDPDFGKKSSDKELALNTAYNAVYELYSQKKYKETLQAITKLGTEFGQNELSPQLSYLNALATGHTQKLPEFEKTLTEIVEKYPNDKLVTPLVQQHLLYIGSYRSLFTTRTTALTEFNPFEPAVLEPETQQAPSVANVPVASGTTAVTPVNPAVKPPTPNQKPAVTAPVNKPVEKPNATNVATPVVTTPPKAEPVPVPVVPKVKPPYDLPPVAEYYFVINVSDPGVTLSSSRFGIGQFNRSSFSGNPIKHQLKAIADEAQIIFVGPFENLDVAKYYETQILPLMKDIMKVPSEKYSTFVITKVELDKLTDNKKINAYLDFYKNINK